MLLRLICLAALLSTAALCQAPHPIPGGYALPNGWRITPVGKSIPTEDLILNITASKDGKAIVAQHGP